MVSNRLRWLGYLKASGALIGSLLLISMPGILSFVNLFWGGTKEPTIDALYYASFISLCIFWIVIYCLLVRQVEEGAKILSLLSRLLLFCCTRHPLCCRLSSVLRIPISDLGLLGLKEKYTILPTPYIFR